MLKENICCNRIVPDLKIMEDNYKDREYTGQNLCKFNAIISEVASCYVSALPA